MKCTLIFSLLFLFLFSTLLVEARNNDDLLLRLNDIQVLGTHNSFRPGMTKTQEKIIQALDPERAARLAYAHPTLTEQLNAGVRTIQLDLYYDPLGGRFSVPLINKIAKKMGIEDKEINLNYTELNKPGIKVLHSKDDDYRSHCLSLERCLNIISEWSNNHSNHIPLYIILEIKPVKPSRYFNYHLDRTTVLPFENAAFKELEQTIVETIGKNNMLTPNDVKKGYKDLRTAVTTSGWPTLNEVRGKIAFLLLETRSYAKQRVEKAAYTPIQRYMEISARQKEPLMFIQTRNPKSSIAAFVKPNVDPRKGSDVIKSLIDEGFIVQANTDDGTKEARTGDVSRREAAFNSGAQIIITDFIYPEPNFGHDYFVEMKGRGVFRCSPLRTVCHKINKSKN